MKKISPFALTLLTLVNSPAMAGTFLGFSSSAVGGDAGYSGMNEACIADYGPNARICNSREIIDGGNLVADPGIDFAWVSPTIVGAYYGETAGVVVDASGITGNSSSSLNCEGYSRNNNSFFRALIVTGTNFAFNTFTCNGRSEQVACCDAKKCFAFPD